MINNTYYGNCLNVENNNENDNTIQNKLKILTKIIRMIKQ